MASRFLNNVTVNDSYTLPSADGTANQIIQTDGAGQLSFVDQSTISSGSSEKVVIYAKNTYTASIAKGTPVYITGTVGATDTVTIAPADAGNSAMMPAVGILDATLAVNDFGYVITGGFMDNITTDPIDGVTPSSNQTVYVKSGGGLTLTKPTGSQLIQNIAKVGKVSGGNAGSLIVSSILRTNDVPNLTTGKIWVGSSTYTTESTVVHLDESNERMGIGTTSPNSVLDVSGAGNFLGGTVISGIDTQTDVGIAIAKGDYIKTNDGNYLRNIIGQGATGDIEIGQAATGLISNITLKPGTSGDIKFFPSGSQDVTFASSGNVGIGTTSPATKLHIYESNALDHVTIDGNNGDNRNLRFATENSTRWNLYTTGTLESGSNVGSDFTIARYTDAGSYINNPFTIVRSSGNVGIGTTSPTSDVHLYKNTNGDVDLLIQNAYAGSSATATLNMTANGNNFAVINYPDADVTNANRTDFKSTAGGSYFTFSTANAEKMRIDSTGAIKFNSYGSGTFTGTATQRLAVDSSGNVIEIPIGSGAVDGSGTANYVTKWTDADTIGDSIIYDNGTNVGIGTTSPATKLEVYTANGTESSVRIRQASQNYWDLKSPASNTSFTISDVGGEKMRITSTGNVGIGETSIDARLHITTATAGLVNQKFESAGSAAWRIGIPASQTYFAFDNVNDSLSAPKVVIDSSGNVGIGTTNPGAKLQVGDGTFDANARVFHSDNTYTEMRGYGIVTNRTTNYYRPTADKTQVLAIGNDGNTWNYISHNANYHTFSTDLAERMRINLGGDVGIGTTSPSQLLHVAGNSATAIITLQRTDANTSGSYGALQWTASDDHTVAAIDARGDGDNEGAHLLFHTTSAAASNDPYGINERMRITSDGNVGIGVTTFNTGERFVVSKGSIGATSLNGLNDAVIEGSGDTGLTILSPNTNYGSIAFGDPQNGAIGRIRYQHSTNAMTFNTNGSEYMRIISNGNVGIGTTSPSAKLELSGTSGQLLVLDDSSATGNPFMSFYQAGTRRSYIQHLDAGDLLTLASEYGGIKFMTGTLGTEVDRVVIDSTGNVGINTTAPTEKLAVTGNIETTQSANGVKIGFNVGDSFTLNGADTAHYGLSCGVSTSVPLVLSGYYGVAIATNGLERVRILQSNGYFGILTTTPAYELDVTGTIRATGNVIAFSDARVKENIKTIDSALEKVNKLRGVEFNKIGEEKTCIGVIAQEVEEVLPEVVETDDNGMKAVAYGNMVGLLIEAMKEQQKQIDELKAKLESYGS